MHHKLTTVPTANESKVKDYCPTWADIQSMVCKHVTLSEGDNPGNRPHTEYEDTLATNQ